MSRGRQIVTVIPRGDGLHGGVEGLVELIAVAQRELDTELALP